MAKMFTMLLGRPGDGVRLAGILRAYEVFIDRTAGRLVKQATFLAERQAKINAPVKTGRLRSSVSSRFRKLGQYAYEGRVSANVKYAAAVEYGVGPHNRRTADGGSYTHPGQRAKPYMRPAVAFAANWFKKSFRQKLRQGPPRARQ